MKSCSCSRCFLKVSKSVKIWEKMLRGWRMRVRDWRLRWRGRLGLWNKEWGKSWKVLIKRSRMSIISFNLSVRMNITLCCRRCKKNTLTWNLRVSNSCQVLRSKVSKSTLNFKGKVQTSSQLFNPNCKMSSLLKRRSSRQITKTWRNLRRTRFKTFNSKKTRKS